MVDQVKSLTEISNKEPQRTVSLIHGVKGMYTRACLVDFPATANCLLSMRSRIEERIQDNVKPSVTFAIWHVNETGLKSFSILVGGFCRVWRQAGYNLALATLEKRRELEPKCVPQLFLGSLLGTRRLAIGQFFPFPSKRGVKEGPTHESRKKSRNNASRGLKFRVHVSRKFPK